MKNSKLVIVESPTKARTLTRFLGGGEITVLASMGHVRDLPQSSLGVDLQHQFKPDYTLTANGKKVMSELKKAAAKATDIYLATDPDREGEAIAWHLHEMLKKQTKGTFHRVTFHEITRSAIEHAFEEPGEVDMHRVDAQQARRVLDRLVGYQVSPLLWKNIQRGTSAGRVQSVALRLICERQKAIDEFVPVEYWNLDATFRVGQTDSSFDARLAKLDGKKPAIGSADQANELAGELEAAAFQVANVAKKPKKRRAAPPFITSTLQQAAGTSLRFGTSRTMRVAQQLYEGLDVGAEGAVGLITYMRTDSVAIAKEARESARGFIKDTFGADYIPAKPNVYSTKKGAQAAHEAIRPTDVNRTPQKMAPFLSSEQLSLYKLIWNRFVASQMAPAQLSEYSIEVEALGQSLTHSYLFRATTTKVIFPGFLSVYNVKEADQDDEDVTKNLPDLKPQTPCDLAKLDRQQCFTQPPRLFSEATLVKELEQNGVGRPSTYASIIHTILQREYVNREKGRLSPTPLGVRVNDYLVGNMPDLFEVSFTADMETKLDDIEEGKVDWTGMLDHFYTDFQKWVGTSVQALTAAGTSDVSRLLDVFTGNVQWAEPVKRGRRTYDDSKFFESIRGKVEKDERLTDRQWQALLVMCARYADQLPAVLEVADDLGLRAELEEMQAKFKEQAEMRASGEADPEVTAMLEALSNVTWAEPVKRGKRTYDDKKFCTSLADQAEQGRTLSDAQKGALKKLVIKYRNQVTNFDALASQYGLEAEIASPAQTQALEALISLASTINEWDAPQKRGKRTFDDREFCDSIKSQLAAKGTLSDRQVAAFKKLLSKYHAQIPGYDEKASELGLTPPPPQNIQEKCPECGGEIVARQARGRQFFGCKNYPKCRFAAKSLEDIPS